MPPRNFRGAGITISLTLTTWKNSCNLWGIDKLVLFVKHLSEEEEEEDRKIMYAESVSGECLKKNKTQQMGHKYAQQYN